MIDALITEIESMWLVWRVSSPGFIGTDTRAEAMVRSQGGKWIFGYGETSEEALQDVLIKWKGGERD